MTNTTYTVKAIGPRMYRDKKFATANEAHKYLVNLMGWKHKNHINDTWTIWVDEENNRCTRYIV